MPSVLPRLTLATLGFGLLLAGCARHAARPGEAPAAGQPGTTAAGAPAPAAPAAHGAAPRAAKAAELPENTGIPACDNYLSSYVACHRAAAIYKPDEIQGRYEAMRTSLLRDSQDARIRPQLAARCNSLASQLRQALHGRSCEGAPAPSSSTPD